MGAGRRRRGERPERPEVDPEAGQLSAEEAARRLGIKPSTLYAYVSRGLIRSLPGHSGPARRYLRSDVERLRARRSARTGPPAGETLLSAGEPVLDSAITWLTESGPVYRGHPALELAREGVSFESVTELLLTGERPPPPGGLPPLGLSGWGCDTLGLPLRSLRSLLAPRSSLIGGLCLVTAALGARDSDRHDARLESVLPKARRLIRRLAASVALPFDPSRCAPALGEPRVAGVLAVALGLRATPKTVQALERALILLADHELNASAFAARVAASTHADVYACVGAGLAALSGPRHGAAVEQVLALIRSIGSPGDAERRLRDELRLGARIPGFGHQVYPGPDPRAEPLLALAGEMDPEQPGVRIVKILVEAMRRAGRPAANVDAALAALVCALGIEPEASPALIVIGRTAGLIAHALEQRTQPRGVLRPRARYREVRTGR